MSEPSLNGKSCPVRAQLGKGPKAFKVPPGFMPVGVPKLKPQPLVRPLTELVRASANDGNTLLGDRFLCRGGGLLFVGSSGIGKSTAVVQMGICWAVEGNALAFGHRNR